MQSAPYRQTILIIDDNPDNLRVAVEHLAAYSFEVRTARDGEAGMRRARNGTPDLILLDVQMPGMDGYETCRRLKADPKLADIPVIFMTARSDIRDKVQAFEVGGVDYVTKPFEASELMARVRTHLKLRSLQRALSESNASLESQVAQQTEVLRRELEVRASQEQQRAHLLELVRSQGEELRALTRRWMEGQRARDKDLADTLQQHITTRLEMVTLHLTQIQDLLPDDRGRWSDPAACREHLETALALMSPVLRGTLDIQGSLTGPPPKRARAESALLGLSTREYEVLQLMAEGKPNKAIAFMLQVAPSTVNTYRTRIMEKLEVDDLPSLIRILLQHEPQS